MVFIGKWSLFGSYIVFFLFNQRRVTIYWCVAFIYRVVFILRWPLTQVWLFMNCSCFLRCLVNIFYMKDNSFSITDTCNCEEVVSKVLELSLVKIDDVLKTFIWIFNENFVAWILKFCNIHLYNSQPVFFEIHEFVEWYFSALFWNKCTFFF